MAKSALVIGGGIAGMQAALDLADQGFKVYLVDRNPSIGGKMAQLDKTFPTLDCAQCMITPKLVDTGSHPNIELLTYSEVTDITGEAGNFTVKVTKKPRFVDEEKCIGCGICSEHCPIEVPSEYNLGLGPRKAIYTPFPQAVPLKYTIDMENCIRCGICEKMCGTKAVDFNQEPKNITFNVGAIVVATGYDLYDAKKKEEYGYGRYKNVITSLQLERLVSPSGPTGGHVIRPSDGKIPKRVAFIQCVCSRDVKMYPYCSRFCCMAAMKEGILIKEKIPQAEIAIFYMDIRAFGKGFEEFYRRAESVWGIEFIKGRPAVIYENPETTNLIVHHEDIFSGKIEEREFDMVVLSVGVMPSPGFDKISRMLSIPVADDNFFKCENPEVDAVSTRVKGIFMAGCAEGPKDIPDSVIQASAAAMRASIILKDKR